MGIEYRQLDVATINWNTTDKSWIPPANTIWYFLEEVGSIFSLIGNGTNTLQELYDEYYINIIQSYGLYKGRISAKSSQPQVVTASGWYQIAKMNNSATDIGSSAIFTVIGYGGARSGGMMFFAEFHEGSQAKTDTNTSISLIGRGSYNTVTGASSGVTSVRIAKNDSSGNSGCFIEIYIDVFPGNSYTFITNMFCNMSYLSNRGFLLMPAAIGSTGLTPSGASATYLEAGATFNFGVGQHININTFIPGFTARKSGPDQLLCSVIWPTIPKPGTVITMTMPTSFSVYDGAGNSATVTGAHTISSVLIYPLGRRVSFAINETGAFSGLNSGPSQVIVQGTTGKLTIS